MPFRNGYSIGSAEAARQRQEAVGRQILVAEEDHQVIEQSLANGLHRRHRQIIGEIDAMQFGTERAGDRSDLERRLAHGHPPYLPASVLHPPGSIPSFPRERGMPIRQDQSVTER